MKKEMQENECYISEVRKCCETFRAYTSCSSSSSSSSQIFHPHISFLSFSSSTPLFSTLKVLSSPPHPYSSSPHLFISLSYLSFPFLFSPPFHFLSPSMYLPFLPILPLPLLPTLPHPLPTSVSPFPTYPLLPILPLPLPLFISLSSPSLLFLSSTPTLLFLSSPSFLFPLFIFLAVPRSSLSCSGGLPRSKVVTETNRLRRVGGRGG